MTRINVKRIQLLAAIISFECNRQTRSSWHDFYLVLFAHAVIHASLVQESCEKQSINLRNWYDHIRDIAFCIKILVSRLCLIALILFMWKVIAIMTCTGVKFQYYLCMSTQSRVSLYLAVVKYGTKWYSWLLLRYCVYQYFNKWISLNIYYCSHSWFRFFR